MLVLAPLLADPGGASLPVRLLEKASRRDRELLTKSEFAGGYCRVFRQGGASA